MHDTAYEHGRLFFELYWSEGFRKVVELGSQDVNGSLRDHCPTEAKYIGVDMMPAKGVDLVVGPGGLPIASESVDVVVTSSAVEHDICFWETFLELARILRPGGLLYVNAPSNGPFHRCPLDCWRFYPDAGVALARWAARRAMTLEVVESFVAQPKAHGWADFIAVFHKAGGPALARRGRIADSAEAINVFDVGMQAGAALERETSFMPGIAAIKNGMSKLQAREAEMKDPSQVAAQIAALEKALAEVAAQQVVAVQNLEAIRASTSWRLTAVLRWLAVAVRGR